MSRATRGGFVLLTVLWALVIVGGLATLFLAGSRDLVRIGAHRDADLRARHWALAGVERAHHRLAWLNQREPPGGERVARATRPGLMLAWNDLDSTFAPIRRDCAADLCHELRVLDLGTRINVNVADERVLEGLFRALGVGGGEAYTAAQSIADWVDADDRPRRQGAERGFYLSSPGAVVPRNGPIRDLAELRRVRGVGDGLLRRALPYLTTWGSGAVNLNTAPEPVLAGALGFGSPAVGAVVRARREGAVLASRSAVTARLRRAPRAARDTARGPEADWERIVFEAQEVEVTSSARAGAGGRPVTVRALFRREPRGVVLVARVREDAL